MNKLTADLIDHALSVEAESRSFPVQRLIMGFSDRPRPLYLAQGARCQVRESGAAGEVLLAAAGAKLSFESYFNSFFPRYWAQYAPLGRLGVRIKAVGTYRLTWCQPGGTELHRVDVASAVAQRTVLWLPDAVRDQVFSDVDTCHVRFECATECRIEKVEFVTDIAPRQRPVLSIGLCTFNREMQLAKTLQTLRAHRDALPELERIYLVNQGEPLNDPELLEDCETLNVVHINQDNLGGAGGFTRTLFETAHLRKAATHHLLMDDDIQLDPRAIRRALDFLAYTQQPLVIGGTMLINDKPRKLHEAGAIIQEGWDLTSVGQHLDVGRPQNLASLAHPKSIDYNAWWFALFPTDAVRAQGLPLPVFLHGDDIEYGCRMKHAGVPTVVPPGVAVWHDAFEGKPRDWMDYYDIRNILIRSALHPHLNGQRTGLEVLGMALFRLVCHRYETTARIREAIEDYLKGPEHVFAQGPGARHEALIEKSRNGDGVPVPAAELPPDRAADALTHFPGPIPEIAALFVKRIAQITLPHVRKRPLYAFRLREDHSANLGPGAYVLLDNPDRSGGAIYKPKRRALWAGLVGVFWTTGKYALRSKTVIETWQREGAYYRTPDYWSKAFGIQMPHKSLSTTSPDEERPSA